MTQPKPTRGGKREGAGRTPSLGVAKVTLSLRVTPDVASYLKSTGNASTAVEAIVRKAKAFREAKKTI